ncbi:hypothetical protein JHK84_045213 [Glycine max]|nr:hypothetical protein JHK86_045155 [Glycine max]KAG5108306.1 hypothetical protein JHK84_045213 [Glycine max]
MQTKDETQTNLVNLLRKIYLTIMSSVDFEEAGHELLKIKLKPDQEMELCIMLLECCSQKRKYLRYYGLLGQKDESGSSDSSDYGTASSEKGDSACSDESDSENGRRGRKRRRKCDAILCYCRRPLHPQN